MIIILLGLLILVSSITYPKPYSNYPDIKQSSEHYFPQPSAFPLLLASFVHRASG